MKNQMIIALGREYGSGGHDIAKKIAEDLGIHYYDREILEGIAEENNIQIEYLERYDEKNKKVILSRNVRGYTNSIEEIVSEMQFEYLRKKAETGESFVIVGRCGEEIFRGDERLISFYILGDKGNKIRRISERHQVTRKKAAHMMKKKDRERRRYHNKHSETKWGDSKGYDLCINSSKLGIEKTAEVLEKYIAERTSTFFEQED